MLKVGRLHARLQSYQDKKKKTLETIKEMFDLCPDAYVSCSFGKDSNTLFHLAMQINKDVEARCILWDESQILHDYEKIQKEWVAKFGAKIRILNLTRDSIDDVVPSRWDQLAGLNPAIGNFVGLRAQESKGRRTTLRKDGMIYKRKNGMYRLCPLAWWTHHDIAAYTYEYGLPMLEEYEKRGSEARTSVRVTLNTWGIREKMLNQLKNERPQDFERLAEIYEEVREYV